MELIKREIEEIKKMILSADPSVSSRDLVEKILDRPPLKTIKGVDQNLSLSQGLFSPDQVTEYWRQEFHRHLRQAQLIVPQDSNQLQEVNSESENGFEEVSGMNQEDRLSYECGLRSQLIS